MLVISNLQYIPQICMGLKIGEISRDKIDLDVVEDWDLGRKDAGCCWKEAHFLFIEWPFSSCGFPRMIAMNHGYLIAKFDIVECTKKAKHPM